MRLHQSYLQEEKWGGVGFLDIYANILFLPNIFATILERRNKVGSLFLCGTNGRKVKRPEYIA